MFVSSMSMNPNYVHLPLKATRVSFIGTTFASANLSHLAETRLKGRPGQSVPVELQETANPMKASLMRTNVLKCRNHIPWN
jgi:hypothetical protein